MSDQIIRPYTGQALREKTGEIPISTYRFVSEGNQFKLDSEPTPNKEVLDPYFPGKELQEAVELMQILQRPLLLRGEPGCGKTKVAQAVAYEWYGAEYRKYYYEWHVKSASKAQEGLYTFDHIARLRNATAPARTGESTQPQEEDRKQYRQLGPLGKAFAASEKDKPAILLIDEIDKADIDFPNDLLLELDEMRFKIPETGEEIIPKRRPLIFITSNQERELPQAFLRRCLFHFIKFPSESLESILYANFPDLAKGKTEEERKEKTDLVKEAIARFEQLRADIRKNPSANKSVSTSELKDWVRILEYYFSKGSKPDLKDPGALPYNSALVKTENDLKSLRLLPE